MYRTEILSSLPTSKYSKLIKNDTVFSILLAGIIGLTYILFVHLSAVFILSIIPSLISCNASIATVNKPAAVKMYIKIRNRSMFQTTSFLLCLLIGRSTS
jgi:hypothetical protein